MAADIPPSGEAPRLAGIGGRSADDFGLGLAPELNGEELMQRLWALDVGPAAATEVAEDVPSPAPHCRRSISLGLAVHDLHPYSRLQ